MNFFLRFLLSVHPFVSSAAPLSLSLFLSFSQSLSSLGVLPLLSLCLQLKMRLKINLGGFITFTFWPISPSSVPEHTYTHIHTLCPFQLWDEGNKEEEEGAGFFFFKPRDVPCDPEGWLNNKCPLTGWLLFIKWATFVICWLCHPSKLSQSAVPRWGDSYTQPRIIPK